MARHFDSLAGVLPTPQIHSRIAADKTCQIPSLAVYVVQSRDSRLAHSHPFYFYYQYERLMVLVKEILGWALLYVPTVSTDDSRLPWSVRNEIYRREAIVGLFFQHRGQ